MNIDAELVDYIARLSRLKLSEEEKNIIAPQLKEIVEYIEKLSELDVEKVDPVDHLLDIKDVYREDEPGASYDREDILKNAPVTDGAFFEVPKII